MPLPFGRVADPLQCYDKRPPTRTNAFCSLTYVGEKPTGPTIDDPPRHGPPPLPNTPPCYRVTVVLCGVPVEGTWGSYTVTCRDEQDQPTGTAQLVAPDGSVLVEGACDHGHAIGAWFWWSFGQLESASAIVDRQPVGLHLVRSNGKYYQFPEPL